MSTYRRGRGSYYYPRTYHTRPSPTSSTLLGPDLEITDGLRPVALSTLEIPKFLSAEDKDVKITNLEYIGSYNWVGGTLESPTIVVPGSPPEWKNKVTPYQVSPDTDTAFVDQNGYWFPSARFAPLFAAVKQLAKDNPKKTPVDWSSVDIITDRNGLRKLMRWISGQADREFRIDLQLSRDGTVLLNRWEKRTRECPSGYTYGHNFEKASTVPAKGCKSSTGHHRIVQYDMNGLNIVVRFEVDACLPSAAKSALSAHRRTLNATSESSIDALAASLASTSLSESITPTRKSVIPIGDKALTIVKGGQEIPQSSLVELTTISEKRLPQYTWEEQFPQLFLSQTPHHFLGVHRTGRFIEVQKRKLGSSDSGLADKERDCQPHLKKLRKALGKIVDLALEHGEQGRISLVCRGGKMEVFQRVDEDMTTPESLMNLLD